MMFVPQVFSGAVFLLAAVVNAKSDHFGSNLKVIPASANFDGNYPYPVPAYSPFTNDFKDHKLNFPSSFAAGSPTSAPPATTATPKPISPDCQYFNYWSGWSGDCCTKPGVTCTNNRITHL